MDSNKRPESMQRITTPELANAFIEEQVYRDGGSVCDSNFSLDLAD